MNIKIKLGIILMLSFAMFIFYYLRYMTLSFISMNIMCSFVIISNFIEEHKKTGRLSFLYIIILILQGYLMYSYIY